jgi:glucosyl-dolichyl phosphate glucuronosyltransferase
MDISVILCTYNRCDSLRRVLDSLCTVKGVTSIAWELIIVDNNSKDQTKEVVESFINAGGKHIRYLFECRQGKSFALNSGIEAAKGEILAFTDDDVTVHPQWLWEIKKIFDTYDCLGVGGKIIPVIETEFPSWMSLKEPFLGPLVAYDLGIEPCTLRKTPFGANMAFRKNVFQKYGLFRTDLGPVKGNPMGKGEDSELSSRLLSAGEIMMYAPDALVYHPAEKERMQKKYYTEWFYNLGRSTMMRSDQPPEGIVYWFGVPRYLLRRILTKIMKWFLAFEAQKRFCCKLEVYQVAGEIVEFYKKSKCRTSTVEERISVASE